MEFLESVMKDFEVIEMFVIKATILISAVIFCLNYIWNHFNKTKK